MRSGCRASTFSTGTHLYEYLLILREAPVAGCVRYWRGKKPSSHRDVSHGGGGAGLHTTARIELTGKTRVSAFQGGILRLDDGHGQLYENAIAYLDQRGRCSTIPSQQRTISAGGDEQGAPAESEAERYLLPKPGRTQQADDGNGSIFSLSVKRVPPERLLVR